MSIVHACTKRERERVFIVRLCISKLRETSGVQIAIVNNKQCVYRIHLSFIDADRAVQHQHTNA